MRSSFAALTLARCARVWVVVPQTPAVAVVEMLQCLSQAVSLTDRRPQGKQADASTLLLQLPHFDSELVKKLKRRKIGSIKGEDVGASCPPSRSLDAWQHTASSPHKLPNGVMDAVCAAHCAELQDLPEAERGEVLGSLGLAPAQVEEVATFLQALPTVHARVTFEMEGEDEIMEQDVAKCKVKGEECRKGQAPQARRVRAAAGRAQQS